MRMVAGSAAIVGVLIGAAVGAAADRQTSAVDLKAWDGLFAHRYDYVAIETAGLARRNEPIELTLTASPGVVTNWNDEVRVVRLDSSGNNRLVAHQILGRATASVLVDSKDKAKKDRVARAPAESVNIVFLAECAARKSARFRVYWAQAKEASARVADLPRAAAPTDLVVNGEPPGLTIENEHYALRLDPKSGALRAARRVAHDDSRLMLYRNVPTHFGADVWSPPQSWDHDYDWKAPPNHKLLRGPIATRYHRWGPFQHYTDVVASITYTFYAQVPYIHVSTVFDFTADRSVRAVRMGEIVVDHSRKPGVARDPANEGREVFTHYAWPDEAGGVFSREINAHRDPDGMENVEGLARGAIGILERDVPWVAGYNTKLDYGMASLRLRQFVGNRLGGPIPHTAPCTYVANYGWAFTYWSRPMVYPLGLKGTDLDRNMALAAGTLFATEEALLVFEPDASLRVVREARQRLVAPLRHKFKGTGPW